MHVIKHLTTYVHNKTLLARDQTFDHICTQQNYMLARDQTFDPISTQKNYMLARDQTFDHICTQQNYMLARDQTFDHICTQLYVGRCPAEKGEDGNKLRTILLLYQED